MKQLNLARKGAPLIVSKLTLDRKEKARLASIGVYENAKIVLMSESDGSVIVSAAGSKIAIDRSVAARIYVDDK